MAAIRHQGTEYTGQAPESIVRRVWGRTAMLRYGSPAVVAGDGLVMADVVKVNRPETRLNGRKVFDVLARVVVER